MFNFLKKILIRKEKYPCKNCIVKVNCSKLCDKVEIDEDVLLERTMKEDVAQIVEVKIFMKDLMEELQ